MGIGITYEYLKQLTILPKSTRPLMDKGVCLGKIDNYCLT